MYFVWGVLFAYLPFLLLWVFGKIEVKRKTGPPKPKPPTKPPPEVVVRKEPKPKSVKPHPFDGIRVEVIKEGGRVYAVTSKNGRVTDKSLRPTDKFSAEDWDRTVRAGANLMGLTKVSDWAWEWRGSKPCPQGTSYTTTHQYDRHGNIIKSETVYHE